MGLRAVIAANGIATVLIKIELLDADGDTLSVEDRLRRVEKWIYNYKAPSEGPMRF